MPKLPLINILKNLKSIIFILAVISCAIPSASAQTVHNDTAKPSRRDTTNTFAGRLPGFSSQQKGGEGKNDASGFRMNCGPYKPNKSTEPLIIVDGKKIRYKKWQKINVNTIKSISILKDSASISKYGRKARNGVLIVTTKKERTTDLLK